MASRFPDRAFVVATPVNLVENVTGENLSSALWLGCVVRPNPDRSLLERVTQPDDDAWFLFPPSGENRPGSDAAAEGMLAEALRGHATVLGELPIVVRLAGSPLMRLPAIQDEESGLSPLGQDAFLRVRLDGDLARNDEGDTDWVNPVSKKGLVSARLVHATLLDEHHSIRLSLPEVVEAKGELALPAEFASALGGAKFWRYWVLLGVEMSDPVIRYRVVAQILGVGLRAGATDHRSKRRGVALNRRRLNLRAVEMLAWCGFDVVGDVTAPLPMAAEFQHFVAHLTTTPQGQWPEGPDRPCALPAQPEAIGHD